jgi:SNF family Na+-dependent transporter
MEVFTPWDLTFGSGMQILGSLLAVITIGWCVNRSAAIAQLSSGGAPIPAWLYYWIRYGITSLILALFVWWFLTNVVRSVSGV